MNIKSKIFEYFLVTNFSLSNTLKICFSELPKIKILF